MDDRPKIDTFNQQKDVAPVSFWLKRAAQYSADLYAAQLGKSGLTQRQFTVLEAVQRNEGGSQTDLVRKTGIDRSTLADLINRLETQGYLRRQRSEKDARVNFVFLTDTGSSSLGQAQPHMSLVDLALIDSLPARNRKVFLESLQMLSVKLDQAED